MAARYSALSIILASALGACVGEEEASDAPPAQESAAVAPAEAAYRGSGLARQACAQCHHVTAGAAPAGLIADAFVDIANREGVTRVTISNWLMTTHPSMPNFIFDEQTVGDLSLYIMSLRRDDR